MKVKFDFDCTFNRLSGEIAMFTIEKCSRLYDLDGKSMGKAEKKLVVKFHGCPKIGRISREEQSASQS